MSPTQRTLAEIRKQGFIADVAEHWNAFSRRRKDLFGWIDVCYLSPRGVVGVQTTSGPNHAARRKKILGECSENVRAWLKSHGIVEIWSWSKRKQGRKKWHARVEEITLEYFDESQNL